METSAQGLWALAGHEGIVLSRYFDSKKVPTIGVGHTAAAGYPNPATYTGELTLSEALSLFKTDIKRYEREVNAAVKVPLKQHEFDALVSFHYNTGAIGKASFVKKLNAGDKAGALKGIMDWRKPAEIIPRRTAERDLFKTGKYPAPFAMLYPATAAGVVQWSKGKRVDLREALPATPKPAHPKASEPKTSSTPATASEPRGGFWAALLSILKRIFGGN